MISVGSVDREEAARRFPFLAASFQGRRAAIREFTHRAPDFVFWIAPDGRLHDARNSHLRHPPKGQAHILRDEPDYGGYLRGRVASLGAEQLVVVYCRPETLAEPGPKLHQFLTGIARFPIPVQHQALVISDNGDLYGTLADLHGRQLQGEPQRRGDAEMRKTGRIGQDQRDPRDEEPKPSEPGDPLLSILLIPSNPFPLRLRASAVHSPSASQPSNTPCFSARRSICRAAYGKPCGKGGRPE